MVKWTPTIAIKAEEPNNVLVARHPFNSKTVVHVARGVPTPNRNMWADIPRLPPVANSMLSRRPLNEHPL